MEELHQHEQYFFDQPTIQHLSRFLSQFPDPCCLCAPGYQTVQPVPRNEVELFSNLSPEQIKQLNNTG